MSDTEHTRSTSVGDDHGTGHDDGHGPAGEALGPVDLDTWAYALAGSILGLLTIIALYVASGA